MARAVRYSPLNTHAMRQLAERPAQYHRGHLDDSLQQDLLLPFQVRDIYLNKVERGDRFRFAVNATANTAVQLDVIDCHGIVYASMTPAASTAVPGATTPDGTPYTSYVFRAANLNAVAADGVYYLRLVITWAGGSRYVAFSEPFDLAASHPDTVYIEYRHSENKEGMYFENLPARLGVRVPGYLAEMETMSSDTVYQDQGYNTVPLDGNAYRNWTLRVLPVADYMRDKLNHIFTCDYVLINGVQYTKASESASWEKQGAETAPLYAASLTIQEADGDAGNVYIDPTLPLFTAPIVPYALTALTVQDGALIVSLLPPGTAGYIPGNGAAEAAMIAAINAALPARELFGTVSKVSGVLIYTNGPGENFRAASAKVYSTFFGFTFVSPGPVFPGPLLPALPLTFRRAGGIIDWGDGNIEAIPFTVSNTTVTHQYAGAAGNYTVRIFGQMEAFGVSGPRSGLTGTLPAGLKSLSIFGGTFPSNTFNFGILAPVASTLTFLAIQNAGLTAANGFNSYYMPNLQLIDFSGNAFSTNVVGAFMYDVHRNASNGGTNNPVISNGTFSIGGQTTGAILNAQANIYRALLQGAPFYWTINS